MKKDVQRLNGKVKLSGDNYFVAALLQSDAVGTISSMNYTKGTPRSKLTFYCGLNVNIKQ